MPRRVDRRPRQEQGGPGTDAEIEFRRTVVFQLRYLQNLTVAGIQRALSEMDPPMRASIETVTQDIAWWVQHARERYDLDQFDPREAIQDAVMAFDFVRSRALRDAIGRDTSVKDRQRALMVAATATARKVELLAATGFIRPPAATGPRAALTAGEVRALVEAATAEVIDAELLPPAELIGATA